VPESLRDLQTALAWQGRAYLAEADVPATSGDSVVTPISARERSL
jgi:hypothetical protein